MRERLAENCLGLADLLVTAGQHDEAALLRNGARRFAAKDLPEGVEDIFLGIVERSFSEDGPILPRLLREIEGMSVECLSQETQVEVSSRIIPDSIGGLRLIPDRNGRDFLTFNTYSWENIRGCARPVWSFGPRFTAFYKVQQVITEAFFAQKGGVLTFPEVADVYGHYLLNCKSLKRIHECFLFHYRKGFYHQAGQVIYKIQNLGTYGAEEYEAASGLKKFEGLMEAYMNEYEEILGYPVTHEILEKIALRQIPELLPDKLLPEEPS